MRTLRDAGLAGLTVEQLIELAGQGVDEGVLEAGYSDLTVERILELVRPPEEGAVR